MVYNAMKLFMEVNPQLFDDCSHEYNQNLEHASEKEQSRQDKWEKIAALAQDRRNGRVDSSTALPITTTSGNKISTPGADETDPLSPESARRLEALRISQDDGGNRRAARSVRG